MNARLDALDAEVEAALEPVTNVPYVVLHDACRYLETHYGMSAAASITIGPQKARSAKRLYGIRKKILANEGVCVSPSFSSNPHWSRRYSRARPSRPLCSIRSGPTCPPDQTPTSS